jgi:hypothetical protein
MGGTLRKGKKSKLSPGGKSGEHQKGKQNWWGWAGSSAFLARVPLVFWTDDWVECAITDFKGKWMVSPDCTKLATTQYQIGAKGTFLCSRHAWPAHKEQESFSRPSLRSTLGPLCWERRGGLASPHNLHHHFCIFLPTWQKAYLPWRQLKFITVALGRPAI